MRPRSTGKPVNWSTIEWPPSVGDQGTLIAVRRIGNRLAITVRDNTDEHVAIVETWIPPPTLEEVEVALSQMIGLTIRDVKNANLRTRSDRMGF
jgi:arylamine N-acetyltransferase